jgi:hypothetical protein
MPEYEFKSKIEPEVFKAFETFFETISPKEFSRHLRQVYFHFLKMENSAEFDYFGDLAFELDELFDLLETMEDAGSETD